MRIHSNGPRPITAEKPPLSAQQATSTAQAKNVTRTATVDGFEAVPAVKAPQAQTVKAQAAAPQPEKKKGFFARLGDAVSRVFTGVASAVVGAAKNIGEAVGTFGSGLKDLFTGRFADGFKKLGMSLVKVVQTPVDALLMAGGSAVSAVQTVLGLEPPGRKLTAEETALLKNVYGDTIDLSRIRIKEGDAGLFTLPNRPFAHGDTLYIPKDWLPMSDALLVHEAAHVWQHQNGGTDYMSEALWAQQFGEGYDISKALAENRPWSALNPEQQAEILEKSFEQGLFSDPNATFSFNGQDYTEQVRAMIAEMRARRGAP